MLKDQDIEIVKIDVDGMPSSCSCCRKVRNFQAKSWGINDKPEPIYEVKTATYIMSLCKNCLRRLSNIMGEAVNVL